VLLLRLEVLLVLMEDYKVVLKYQELSVIASLRRFADISLFGRYLSLLFYICSFGKDMVFGYLVEYFSINNKSRH